MRSVSCPRAAGWWLALLGTCLAHGLIPALALDAATVATSGPPAGPMALGSVFVWQSLGQAGSGAAATIPTTAMLEEEVRAWVQEHVTPSTPAACPAFVLLAAAGDAAPSASPWTKVPVLAKSFDASTSKLAVPVVVRQRGTGSSDLIPGLLALVEEACGSYAPLTVAEAVASALEPGKRYAIAFDASSPDHLKRLEPLLALPSHLVLVHFPARPAPASALGKRSIAGGKGAGLLDQYAFLDDSIALEVGTADFGLTAASPSAPSSKPYSRLSLFEKYVFVSDAIFMGLPVVVLLVLGVLVAVHLLASIQTPTKFEGKKKEKQ